LQQGQDQEQLSVLNPDNREATLAQIILSQANHLGEGSTAQLDAKKEDFAGAAAGNAWATLVLSP